jgi:hypothetical protein
MIATLKLAVDLGFADASALDSEEFNGVRGMAEFQALLTQLKNTK